MPDLTSLKAALLAIALLSPGMIITYVRSQFLAGRKASGTDIFLQYLTLTAVYYALTLPWAGQLLSGIFSQGGNAWPWIGLILIGPLAFGFLLGLNAQKDILRKILRWMHIYPVHPIPTAWDWVLSQKGELWVLVTLKNGTQFAGLYGAESFSSSDPAERDLYLQQVHTLGKDDEWIENPGKSLLILAGEISTIECWPYVRAAA